MYFVCIQRAAAAVLMGEGAGAGLGAACWCVGGSGVLTCERIKARRRGAGKTGGAFREAV